jgi:HEAT repeat protein
MSQIIGYCLLFFLLALPVAAATNAAPTLTTTNKAIQPIETTQTNTPSAKTVQKKADLEYWQETMLFGTDKQKETVLKTMQTVESKSVDDILIQALKNEPEGAIQLKIVQMLYDRKIAGALGPLVHTLTNARDADTIAPAIAALARFKDVSVLPQIVRHLTNETLSVQQAVVRAIGEIGDQGPAARLLEMLDSLPASSELRYDLVNALGQLKYEPAFASLRTIAINSGNPHYLRAFAITALGSIGNRKIIDDFVKILGDEKIPNIKIRIIAALGDMPSKESSKAISTAMNDGDERIRATAIKAAAQSKDKDFIRALLYKFRYDTEARVMLAAADALQEMGHAELPSLVLAKFEVTRDVHVLSRFVTILKKCPAQTHAIPMLRKKQKENQFAKVKDEIEELLTLWGSKGKISLPAEATTTAPKDEKAKTEKEKNKTGKEPPLDKNWPDRIYLTE